ncbi:MAG: GNAT family N-acetyltransferase [Brevefilum sp.]|nr:GNAT family N-acetyltransferase [Brevefilum sp.]
MPEIDVRPVVPADLESLSAFEHGYYSDYVWQMSLDLSSEAAKSEFRRTRLPRRVFVPYPRGRDEIFRDTAQVEAFLVAVLDDNLVGYVKVQTEKDDRIARVTDLVVSAAVRRQGIASGLLLAVMELSSHRKYGALIMEMQSKNDPAITMAGKLGFKFCGYRDHYFSNKELAIFFSRLMH